MNFTPAQQTHVRMMREVLRAVQETPLVLKGGTALLLCYGLDRFSEDLDFDAPKKLNLESRIENSLRPITQQLRITRTKDTDTVQRYRIEYESASVQGRLKVEVSCRDAVDETDVLERHGVRTYRAARLIAQKINALENRTTARDLYDVHFLATHFRSEFEPVLVGRLLTLTADVNQLEGRFMPAFEEDDLFRDKAEMLSSLILELHEAMK